MTTHAHILYNQSINQLELREYDCEPSASPPPVESLHDDEEKKEPASSNINDDEEGCYSYANHHHHHHHNGSNGEEDEESEMRGVHARAHILPNTVCMAIPRRCLITVEMGQATPIGQAILHSDLDLDAPKHIFLMIYILWDRKVNGSSSFFHPYYEILPRTLHNMPIFWTRDELAGLEGSYLLHQIADRNQAIADDYSAICAVAPALKQICTLEEFKWARMCVCSRNFGLCMDGHRTSAMVPHADMLNHFRPRETKWTFDEERQAFTITSLQHIPAGAQVYDSYGQKCNHRFLLNYGFAVEDNREMDGFCPNEVPLELYVDPDDPLFSEKLEFWTRGEVSTSAAPGTAADPTASLTQSLLAHAVRVADGQRWFTGGGPVVKRIRVCVSNNDNTRILFSLLRTLACNEAELKAITTPVTAASGSGGLSPESSMTRSLFGLDSALRNSHANFYHHHHHLHHPSLVLTGTPTSASYYRSCRDVRHPISLRNERAAMRLLLDIVGRHLSAYPTSLAQDVADLMDEQTFPRFSNLRHAKIQVRGEKEVLHHFAHWARTALEVLDVIEEELKEERGSVEVHLTKHGSTRVVQEHRPSFEHLIRRMEDDCDVGVHHTILRYCADVLGSLRREETKNIKKLRAYQRSARGNHSGGRSNSSAPGGFRL